MGTTFAVESSKCGILSHFGIGMTFVNHSPWKGLVSHQTSALSEECGLDFEFLVGVPLKLELLSSVYSI